MKKYTTIGISKHVRDALASTGNVLGSYSLEYSITLCTSREKTSITKFEQNNGV